MESLGPANRTYHHLPKEKLLMRIVIHIVLFASGVLLFAVVPAISKEDAPIVLAALAKTVLPDACKLLNDAEVRNVFPDAKAGERERSAEEYGIAGCVWRNATGTIVLAITRYTGEPGSVENDVRGFVHGVVDPVKPAAVSAVRLEKVRDVGDQAMAVVERADDKRGILSNMSYLITQRGERMAMLISTELPTRERSAALKALKELGRAAAKRL
jgi:hypothetical protein